MKYLSWKKQIPLSPLPNPTLTYQVDPPYPPEKIYGSVSQVIFPKKGL
jgi:hypothetical protein